MNGTWRYALVYALTALAMLFAAAYATAAPANNPQSYSFCPNWQTQRVCLEGAYPVGLARGPDHAYYGITTMYGGYGIDAGGTVYRLDPVTRVVSIIHHFNPTTEGRPIGWITVGLDGNLYGGLNQTGSAGSNAAIFRLSLAGEFSLLHVFDPNQGYPNTSPVQDALGNWYGTTRGTATIYKITPEGNFETLYIFTSNLGTNGLVLARDGNLYGTTINGGRYHDGGMVYRITPSGVYTVLHNFQAYDRGGGSPNAALTRGLDGALYGSAQGMFRIALDGQFTSYADPNQPPANGLPVALTLMPDGYFYYAINEDNIGGENFWYHIKIIRWSPAKVGGVLYSFPALPGQVILFSNSPLLRGFDNAIYGTNSHGGNYGAGALFRYVPPPVQ